MFSNNAPVLLEFARRTGGLSPLHACLVATGLLATGLSVDVRAATGAEDAPVPLYEAVRAAKAPAVDGKLDDAVWSQAAHAAVARRAKTAASDPANRVGEWMAAYDDGHLYIAAEVKDATFVRQLAEGSLLNNNDSVELFIDPAVNYRQNLQYRIWPLGRDGQGAEVTKRPTWGQWQVAGRQTDGGYIIEAAIPFSHFQEAALEKVGPGGILGFDLAVVDRQPRKGGKNRRVVTSWAGDGSNWQYARQNGLLALGKPDPARLAALRPDFENIRETSQTEIGAIWPNLELLSGWFQLESLHQSSCASEYRPWRLGGIGHPLLDDPRPADLLLKGDEVSPHSAGEHFDAEARVTEVTLRGVRDGCALELRVTRTPFHPAQAYQTNAPWLSLFDGMDRLGQPDGPTSLALPLTAGAVVRPVGGKPATLYDAAQDGPLQAGWTLVTFAKPGDGLDFDMPTAVFLSRQPERIERNAAGGLMYHFNGQRQAVLTVLPIEGLRPVKAARTADWIKAGKLPQNVTARLIRWLAWSTQLPVDCHQTWQYLPRRHAFHVTHRFAYSPNLSEWPEAGELLAPFPVLFSRPDAQAFYQCPALKDLDFATWFGPLWGVPGAAAMEFELPSPLLKDAPPRLDRAQLEKIPRARPFLEELDALNVPKLIDRAIASRQARPGEFMPHAFPLGSKEDVYAALAVAPPEAGATTRDKLLAVHRAETFNPAKRDVYFPPAAPYLGSPVRYARLTYPYGVAEPYHGTIHTFSKAYQIGKGVGDQSLFLEHWPEVKRISAIIWNGGFVEYRYDGGTMLGEWLLGLLDLAQQAGDRDFERRTRFRLAEYAATAWSFYSARTWLAELGAWDETGQSTRLLGEVQMRTRRKLLPILDRSSYTDYMAAWDRSYGNPAILRPFALEMVRQTEARADELMPDWYNEEATPFKRVDGIVRRFETRALVLREPPERLEQYLAGLREHLSSKTAYAACLATYLKRLQMDAASAPASKP